MLPFKSNKLDFWETDIVIVQPISQTVTTNVRSNQEAILFIVES